MLSVTFTSKQIAELEQSIHNLQNVLQMIKTSPRLGKDGSVSLGILHSRVANNKVSSVRRLTGDLQSTIGKVVNHK